MFFSVVTENLNWEVLTKNLVTFKRWDAVKYQKFLYYAGSLKNPMFHENQSIGRDCLKGGLGLFANLKVDLAKKRRGEGGDTPMHTMW